MQVKLYQLETIDSTNTWAKREINRFDRDSLTVVTAKGQTAGYGRLQRQWVSPANENIYASFCFFVPTGFAYLANIAQVISLAIAMSLDRLQFRVRLKWPNDLMIQGRKVGGILCETSTQDSEIGIIAGVGLNVNMPSESFADINQPVTSLAVEQGSTLDLDQTLKQLVQAIANLLPTFISQGFNPFLRDYRQFLMHMPQDIMQIHQAKGLTTGRFIGIDETGALQLQLADGKISRIT